MPSCFTVFVHVMNDNRIHQFCSVVGTKKYHMGTGQLTVRLCNFKPLRLNVLCRAWEARMSSPGYTLDMFTDHFRSICEAVILHCVREKKQKTQALSLLLDHGNSRFAALERSSGPNALEVHCHPCSSSRLQRGGLLNEEFNIAQ